MRGNPRVSFAVDDFLSWEEIRGVFVSGGAELVSGGGLHEAGRDFIYEKYPFYEGSYPIEEGGWSRYILVITRTRVLSWGL